MSKHHKVLVVSVRQDTRRHWGACVHRKTCLCTHACTCRQELVSLQAGIRRSMCRGCVWHMVMSVLRNTRLEEG